MNLSASLATAEMMEPVIVSAMDAADDRAAASITWTVNVDVALVAEIAFFDEIAGRAVFADDRLLQPWA